MDARRRIVERGLVADAVSLLADRALGALPLEALGPTKALLKRYFSVAGWGPGDDDALAAAVGPGEGWWREPLAGDLALVFGWEGGRFRLAAEGTGEAPPGPRAPATSALAASFEGPIVPEATPNPRTLVFRTGAMAEGESREFRSGEEAGDPRVRRLLDAFPDLSTVLVARDFVALTLRHPDRWEALLGPVLEVVTEEFAGAGEPVAGPDAVAGPDVRAGGAGGSHEGRDRQTRLDRAWAELRRLRPGLEADLAVLLEAASGPDAARRQVAAGLLGEARPEAALAAWTALVGDASRLVRRAAVDAVVDAGRPELRPLLERALADGDAWVRWKALRGLHELGPEPSRPAIQARLDDPDFRVRLEAEAALRS
ncbi:MAG: HEAT repeat domain-containing protein [Actinomycetota bacterium]